VDQLTKQLASMQHQSARAPSALELSVAPARRYFCTTGQVTEAATPGRWEWNDQEKKSVLKDWCQNCGSRDFILNTESPAIGQWHFKCAKCGAVPSETWLQNDRFTTEVLGAVPHAPGERRMEPISYRASSAFYPQTDQFIISRRAASCAVARRSPPQ
jgi:hypothetical protein